MTDVSGRRHIKMPPKLKIANPAEAHAALAMVVTIWVQYFHAYLSAEPFLWRAYCEPFRQENQLHVIFAIV
jgi:hypothetical protein